MLSQGARRRAQTAVPSSSGESRLPSLRTARSACAWHVGCEAQLPAGLDWLAASERSTFAPLRFAPRRRSFLLGRFVVKRAVCNLLGVESRPDQWRRFAISNQQTGSQRGLPRLWIDGVPDRIGLSLSHRDALAVCLLSHSSHSLGVDLERVEPRSAAFVQDFLTVSEQAWVAGAADLAGRCFRANLIWSAKESSLKVFGCGLRADTRRVEVHSVGFEQTAGWRKLRVNVELERRQQLELWWRRWGAFVLTAAPDDSLPPRLLRSDSALLEAPLVPPEEAAPVRKHSS